MRFLCVFIVMVGVAIVISLKLNTAAQAQGYGSDPTVAMLDNCSPADPDYVSVGGCPQEPIRSAKGYQGDVTAAEFFALLGSPLAPNNQLIGHPSWRNEPSYISVRLGQNIRVSNRGGRAHTFTEVANFGGGFLPFLNGALQPAPECAGATGPNPNLTFVGAGGTQTISGLGTGLRKFQCCIHPWMRAAIRVQ